MDEPRLGCLEVKPTVAVNKIPITAIITKEEKARLKLNEFKLLLVFPSKKTNASRPTIARVVISIDKDIVLILNIILC